MGPQGRPYAPGFGMTSSLLQDLRTPRHDRLRPRHQTLKRAEVPQGRIYLTTAEMEIDRLLKQTRLRARLDQNLLEKQCCLSCSIQIRDGLGHLGHLLGLARPCPFKSCTIVRHRRLLVTEVAACVSALEQSFTVVRMKAEMLVEHRLRRSPLPGKVQCLTTQAMGVRCVRFQTVCPLQIHQGCLPVFVTDVQHRTLTV